MISKLLMSALLVVMLLLGAFLGSHLATPSVSAKPVVPVTVSKTITFQVGTFCDLANATVPNYRPGGHQGCVMDSVAFAGPPTSMSLVWFTATDNITVDGTISRLQGFGNND